MNNANENKVIRLRYIGEENYALGLKPGKAYAVSLSCKAGYIVVMWNTNGCLYTSLGELNNEWIDP